MEFGFLIGGILSLLVGLYILAFSIFKCKEKILKKIKLLFGVMGLSFLIESLLFLLAFFSKIEFALKDFYLISAFLLLIRVSLFVSLFVIILSNKNLKYLLIFYIILFVSFFLSGVFYNIFFFVSYLIVFLICLLAFNLKEFTWLAISGGIYASVSLLMSLLFSFKIINILIFEGITLVLFFGFLYNLFKSIKLNLHKISTKKRFPKETNFFIDFLKYFLFIVLLTNFIFVSAVTIHELGHFGTSQFFDCSYSKIVYDGGLPHTEILCQDQNLTSKVVTLFGGILLPFLIALIFFFVGGKFMNEIGLLLVGFGFVISYKDFLALGLSETASLFFGIVGILAVIFSIGFLASSRVEEKQFLYFADGDKDFYRGKVKS